MKETSAGPPSLLPRGRQGAPGLFPPPFCQGLLLDETFKPALPHPKQWFPEPFGKAGTCAAPSAVPGSGLSPWHGRGWRNPNTAAAAACQVPCPALAACPALPGLWDPCRLCHVPPSPQTSGHLGGADAVLEGSRCSPGASPFPGMLSLVPLAPGTAEGEPITGGYF